MATVKSSICQFEHFNSDWYARWAPHIGAVAGVDVNIPASYRKSWEWAAILEGISSRGMMFEGAKGLGFAVGQEPLSSVIAARGPTILASDFVEGQHWSESNEHAASLDALYWPGEITRELFNQRVSFRPINMAELSGLPSNEYEFLWSSCAFEHIGTLDDGLDFVVEAMRCLKPGGVAFHTTEINISSNDDTIADGGNCIYRKRDIELLDRRLRKIRCGLEPIDWNPGAHSYDLDYDHPPYFQNGKVHIKLEMDGHITTSFLLIAHKGG